jgi:hypothetical protein
MIYRSAQYTVSQNNISWVFSMIYQADISLYVSMIYHDISVGIDRITPKRPTVFLLDFLFKVKLIGSCCIENCLKLYLKWFFTKKFEIFEKNDFSSFPSFYPFILLSFYPSILFILYILSILSIILSYPSFLESRGSII